MHRRRESRSSSSNRGLDFLDDGGERRRSSLRGRHLVGDRRRDSGEGEDVGLVVVGEGRRSSDIRRGSMVVFSAMRDKEEVRDLVRRSDERW